MDTLAAADTYLFEGFRLDRRGLARRDDNGCFVPVPVGSRALEILGVLVQRSGELVFRDEIINTVWPGVVVENSNLPAQIGALRRVLDNGRTDASCIQTIPGRGYRFVVPVTHAEAAVAASFAIDGNGSAGSIAAAGQTPPRSLVCGADDPAPAPPRGTRPWPRGPVMTTLAVVAFCLFTATIAAVNWGSLSPWKARSAPRLSIVVLPFANLGHDPDQQYLADAITEDLTTDLSRISHMLVISSGTAFTYRDKPFDAKQIGRELGIRYVLEGSVQRSGGKVRVNAQLVNSATDAHLWAERFDRDAGDWFALQDEITRQIAIALNSELVSAEAARPTEHPDALDYILRARAASNKGNAPDNLSQAIDLFEQALALDPQSVEAKTLLALTLAGRVLAGMTHTRAADIARAEDLIGQALAASPGSTDTHMAKAQLLRAKGRCDEAILELEMVIASNPNAAGAFFVMGVCKLWTGSIDEVIPLEVKAIRLSPRDPNVFNRYLLIGQAQLLQSDNDEAIFSLEKAKTYNPKSSFTRAYLASAYALKGDGARAAAELADAQRLSSDDRYLSVAKLKMVKEGTLSLPNMRALYEATYFAGLRKAGMPEE